MADVQVTDNTTEHRFEVTLDGEVAFADYRLEGRRIVLPHTVVPAAFEGRGVGSALAKAALSYARANRLEVIPRCTFMAGYIRKHPEWHDIVHESCRSELGIG